MNERICPRRESLPISEFAIGRAKASGHKSHCKACDRERATRYYAEHRAEALTKRRAYAAARYVNDPRRARRRFTPLEDE
jgi:hypothetical protein